MTLIIVIVCKAMNKGATKDGTIDMGNEITSLVVGPPVKVSKGPGMESCIKKSAERKIRIPRAFQVMMNVLEAFAIFPGRNNAEIPK